MQHAHGDACIPASAQFRVDRQLATLAQRGARVAIAGAAARRCIDHQFILGLHLEHGGVDAHAAGHHRLGADFEVRTDRRLECEVEAAART